MYTDKTLVCKDCGNEFVFTAGEQEFYAERASRTSPPVARRAVRRARPAALLPVAPARCSTPCALNAASPPRFLSSPGKIALSTAASAMQRVVVNPQRT